MKKLIFVVLMWTTPVLRFGGTSLTQQGVLGPSQIERPLGERVAHLESTVRDLEVSNADLSVALSNLRMELGQMQRRLAADEGR